MSVEHEALGVHSSPAGRHCSSCNEGQNTGPHPVASKKSDRASRLQHLRCFMLPSGNLCVSASRPFWAFRAAGVQSAQAGCKTSVLITHWYLLLLPVCSKGSCLALQPSATDGGVPAVRQGRFPGSTSSSHQHLLPNMVGVQRAPIPCWRCPTIQLPALRPSHHVSPLHIGPCTASRLEGLLLPPSCTGSAAAWDLAGCRIVSHLAVQALQESLVMAYASLQLLLLQQQSPLLLLLGCHLYGTSRN